MEDKRFYNVTCDHMSSKVTANKYKLNNEFFTVKYHDCGNKGSGGWYTSHEVFGASHSDYYQPMDCLRDLLARAGCINIKIVETTKQPTGIDLAIHIQNLKRG